MMEFDGRYYSDIRDLEQKFPKKELARELLPPESSGYHLFPQVLAGRLRPVTLFDQPLESVRHPKSNLLRDLARTDITTIRDLLVIPYSALSVTYSAEMARDLQTYLTSLAITPQARLLEVIEGAKQYAIPASREQELADAIHGLVFCSNIHFYLHIEEYDEDLKELIAAKRQRVMILAFGLVDGITRNPQQVAQILDTSITDVNSTSLWLLYKWRRPELRFRPRKLGNFWPLPEESFGRLAFDAIFQNDLPQLYGEFKHQPVTLALLSLSDVTRDELLQKIPDYSILPISDFLRRELGDVGLSLAASSEVLQALKKLKEHSTVKLADWTELAERNRRIREEIKAVLEPAIKYTNNERGGYLDPSTLTSSTKIQEYLLEQGITIAGFSADSEIARLIILGYLNDRSSDWLDDSLFLDDPDYP